MRHPNSDRVQNRTRRLQTLAGRFQITLKDRSCQQDGCPNKGVLLRPIGEPTISTIRQREYGLDVVTYIGEKRSKEAMSLPKIHESLVDEYGLKISERHVSNLFKVFLALVHCVNADFAPLRKKLEKQGHLILAIDGVSLDDVSNVLYVIRDLVSSEVLYSERVPKQDARCLGTMLKKVVNLGIPIRGVVSDKGTGLVAAVESVLPGVPHQLCQTHFLKNAAKPIEEDLPELSAVITDTLTEIKKLDRELAAPAVKLEAPAAEAELVRELTSAAKAAAKASGDPLLGPAPLKRFERMQAVLETAETARKLRKGTWKLLARLISKLTALNAHMELAARLNRQVAVLQKIAHIFKSESSAKQVRRILNTYMTRLDKTAPTTGADAPYGAFVRHVLAVADRYWAGLFHCYNVDGLPKTNNAMEQAFNIFKRHERKVSGRKSTVGGPVETCAPFVIEAWSTMSQNPGVCELFNQVSADRLQEGLAELEMLAGVAKKRRSIQRNPNRHLTDVLKKWKES